MDAMDPSHPVKVVFIPSSLMSREADSPLFKGGYNIGMIVLDEIHTVKYPKMKTALKKVLALYPSAMAWGTTTSKNTATIDESVELLMTGRVRLY